MSQVNQENMNADRKIKGRERRGRIRVTTVLTASTKERNCDHQDHRRRPSVNKNEKKKEKK